MTRSLNLCMDFAKATLRHSVVLLCSAFALTMLDGMVVAQEEETYLIGIVPQYDTRHTLSAWQPVVNELKRATGANFKLVASPSIPTFEKSIAEERFDFAYMNPYHQLVANRKAGYYPIIRDHASPLQGIVVVRKESPISEVSDLAGKTIAFPSPNALGASLLVRAELDGDHKIDFTPKYLKSHSSVYLNVVTGLLPAGGGVEKTLRAQPVEVKGRLRILYRTKHVSRHPFSVHPRVPIHMARKVQQAFISLGLSEAGRSLLSKIPLIQPDIALMDDYTPLETLGLESYYVMAE